MVLITKQTTSHTPSGKHAACAGRPGSLVRICLGPTVVRIANAFSALAARYYKNENLSVGAIVSICSNENRLRLIPELLPCLLMLL